MGTPPFRNRRRSNLADHHTAYAHACSLRSRKSSFYRRRSPRRRAVHRRRNLLRASLRRTLGKCDCENYQRRRSTISTPRFRWRLRRNVSRKTLDQSARAGSSFITPPRVVSYSSCTSSADIPIAHRENCFAEIVAKALWAVWDGRAIGTWLLRLASRFNRVGHQHRDGHWPHASRDRRDRAGFF